MNNIRDHGAVSFVTVSDLIRDKSIRYNDENMADFQPFVISTSFMSGDDDGTVNVKDEDLDTLDDCFDYTKNSNSDKGFLQPGHHRGLSSQTIKNSNHLATSQFLENSSLEKQRLLACQVTPVLSKSPKNTKVFILQGVP